MFMGRAQRESANANWKRIPARLHFLNESIVESRHEFAGIRGAFGKLRRLNGLPRLLLRQRQEKRTGAGKANGRPCRACAAGYDIVSPKSTISFMLRDRPPCTAGERH